ncbi:hypothetical protein L917_11519, partial [Phytophthora nicotianae]
DALAATLVANESSPRESLSGKTANGRFDKLSRPTESMLQRLQCCLAFQKTRARRS